MHTFTFLGLQVFQNEIADVRNWGGVAEDTNMVLLIESRLKPVFSLHKIYEKSCLIYF